MVNQRDITEIFRDPQMNAEVREDVHNELQARRIVRRLVSLRTCAGLSQTQVAEKIGCSQGKVSKLERSQDDNISLGELRKYAEAVNCKLHIGIAHKELKPVDQVKVLAFAIHRRMKDMAQLAHVDQDIGRAVATFFGEVFYNMSRLITDAAGGLPRQDDGTPMIEFSITQETIEACDDETLASDEEEDLFEEKEERLLS